MKRKPSQKIRSLAPRKPIKRSNPARKKREFARTYGSVARVQFIKRLPCGACSRQPREGVENAHLPSKSGAGRKGDARHIVPLCHDCHEAKAYLVNPEYWTDLAANMERIFPSVRPEPTPDILEF